MNEKLRLAVELRKNGLSLKKIEEQTGISFRELSVIFKYLNDNNISLKDEKRILESKINLLQQENEKLKELLKEEEKEKKDLATQVAVSKYSIKILKPTFFIFILSVAFIIGAGLGISISSKNYVKTFLNQVYQLDKKNKQILELKNKLIQDYAKLNNKLVKEYQNKEIKIKNEYQKKLNKIAELNNFFKLYNISYKIRGNYLKLNSRHKFEIRYLNELDEPTSAKIKELIILSE